MTWLLRAFAGYLIGSFFRMPVLGMLIALFYNPQPHTRTRSKTHYKQTSWNFNSFIREGYQEGRWIVGCFSTLGAFAKAGGNVNKNDIKFAETLMKQWDFAPEHRTQAINAFRYGRQEPSDLILNRLSQSYYWTHTPQGARLMKIVQTYLQGQSVTKAQKILLKNLQDILGSPHSHRSYQHQQHQYQSASDTEDLHWAYKTLHANAQDDKAAVKKKFRKSIAAVHPDRNPDDPKATEKAQHIQKAYSLIKQARGWS